MAIGDQSDFLNRLQTVLPPWWGSDTTIRDGVLSGFAQSLSEIYALDKYTENQTRISTATDIWLDLISLDFFGTGLQRNPGEADAAFQRRILLNLLPDRGTRPAVMKAVTQLTGIPPLIIEPRNPTDCGGWDIYGAWDEAGRWGDMSLPFQFFMIVSRPVGGSIANVSGWDKSGGGWDVGSIEWVDPSLQTLSVTDAEIYSTISNTISAGTIAWVQINPPVTDLLDYSFILDVSQLG